MRIRLTALAALCLGLAACGDKLALPITGTLERDRIELSAEAQEPITQIAVHEGDQVKAGQLVLQLDDSRTRAQLAEAQAARDQAAARIPGAEASFAAAEKDYGRTEALVRQHTRAAAELDRARADRDNARAEVNAAHAALAQAQAALDDARITLSRLAVRAPRDASVDSLPYHLGERPPLHGTVAVLLDDAGAYAEIYVPEPLRARMQTGMAATLRFDGSDKTYTGILRYISSDAAFTPYYSLNERDRSRLAYKAKVYVDGMEAANLPTGAPVSVDFPTLHR